MKKLSKITESTWGDMRRRSSGDITRKEDEVILKLGVSEMYDYLKDTYKDTNKVYWMDGDKKSCLEDRIIDIDPVDGISVYFEYGDDDKLERIGMFYTITSFSKSPKEYPDFFKKLSDKFDVSVHIDKPEFSKQWEIKPKSGELTNKTIIEVIEFFLNTEINESAWGEMRKRSAGNKIRREMTMEEFKNYLEKRYRFTKKYENCDFPMISHNQIYTAIGMPGFAIKNDRLGTSYFHLLLYMVNDGGYVLTLSKTIQKLHIFDVLRNEYIMTDCEKSWDYDIKPKKGRVDKEFFITVLDFINANLQSPEESVVERKPITESAWGEMRKRSSGEQIRKEDDIDNLDRDGLYDYLTSHYKPLNSFVNIQNSSSFNRIDVPVIIQGGADYVYFNFDNNSVFIKFAMPYKVKGLFTKLVDNFSLRSNSDKNPLLYIISPKDGSETTNSFYIEVIDFIIDNIPDSFEKGVKKIVEESAWGEMRKRSSGEVVRKEDDIENLDRDGLYEYIFDLYEQINPFPTPLKSQISQTYTYFSIPIFKLNHKVYRLDCTFDNSKISKITLMANDADVKDFKQVLIDNFDCILRHDGALKITAKDGTVSNQVCMDLIKVIVENTPEPLLKKRD